MHNVNIQVRETNEQILRELLQTIAAHGSHLKQKCISFYYFESAYGLKAINNLERQGFIFKNFIIFNSKVKSIHIKHLQRCTSFLMRCDSKVIGQPDKSVLSLPNLRILKMGSGISFQFAGKCNFPALKVLV